MVDLIDQCYYRSIHENPIQFSVLQNPISTSSEELAAILPKPPLSDYLVHERQSKRLPADKRSVTAEQTCERTSNPYALRMVIDWGGGRNY
jgi:hypothetical protein